MLFQTEIKLSKSEKSLIKSLIFYYENDAKEILEKTVFRWKSTTFLIVFVIVYKICLLNYSLTHLWPGNSRTGYWPCLCIANTGRRAVFVNSG